MKKIIITPLICIVSIVTLHAQDIILKTNGDEIQAKVTEIGTEEIRYKKFENPDGPVYVINKSDVFLIKYANGLKEVYTTSDKMTKEQPEPTHVNNTSSSTETATSVTAAPVYQSSYFRNRQHLYFSLAVGYGNSYGGIGLRAQGRFGRIVGFGIHGGAGYFPSLGGHFLAAGGVKFFPYKWIYINAQFGSFGAYEEYEYYSSSWGDYNDYYNAEILWGPSFLTGVDMIFGKHFGFNAAGGISIDIGDAGTGVWPALDIGFHFKF